MIEEIFGSLIGFLFKIFTKIFNYIGLPFRYIFFLLIGRRKTISYLNRSKKQEPKNTWFNQRTSNIVVGLIILVVALLLFYYKVL